jgi:hypothetical protein
MAFSPQANYTDWATATGRRILVPTLVIHLNFITISEFENYKNELNEWVRDHEVCCLLCSCVLESLSHPEDGSSTLYQNVDNISTILFGVRLENYQNVIHVIVFLLDPVSTFSKSFFFWTIWKMFPNGCDLLACFCYLHLTRTLHKGYYI